MLLLLIFVLFFIVFQNKSIKVGADELMERYYADRNAANKKFLNMNVELLGKFKSFIQSENGVNILELKSNREELKLYCVISDNDDSEKAAAFTNDFPVVVDGKCLGLNPAGYEKFSNSIFIEAEQIK